MRLTRQGLQTLLIYAFVFLGPLGNMLTPPFFPRAFRTFYFTLIFFPLFLLVSRKKELRTLFLFLPFIFYVLISGFFTQFQDLREYTHPFFRSFLFACLCLFMFAAAFSRREQNTPDETNKMIRIFFYGYFISLVAGLFLYIGFYMGNMSLDTLNRFSVETQFGYGILRFSPGSYPNEYGIISSFVLASLTLMIAERKHSNGPLGLSKKLLWMCYLPTFIAFMLTTTRAAYLAFCFSVVYLLFISPRVRRTFGIFLLLFCISLVALKTHFHDLFKTIAVATETISFSSGTSGARVQEWVLGLRDFDRSLLFGTGYGTAIDIHNAYLQLLYEVGFVGIILLTASLFIYFVENLRGIRALFIKKWMNKEDTLSNRIIVIGLIHVFSFALTNHNLNHHLTWFIFLLFNIKILYGRQSEGSEASRLKSERTSRRTRTAGERERFLST